MLRLLPFGLCLGVVFLLSSRDAHAQTHALSSTEIAWSHDTGPVSHDGPGRDAAVVASFEVRVAQASWLRLRFGRALLAGDPGRDGALLRITSHADGAVQELSREHLAEWRNHSAYFNGDSVQVDVVAWPGTGPSRVVLDGVIAGDPPLQEQTQCGNVDDRVASSNPSVARVVPQGCTAWLIDDCAGCLLSAGHCGTPTTVQFNVPASTQSGGLVHPGPEHQYALDPASLQRAQGGVGADWAYFGVFRNSNTGLAPGEAQGQVLTLALPPAYDPTDDVRVTGYGVDSGAANQTQQTDAGAWTGVTGERLLYQVDTMGGNSGSPLIHEPTGLAIGIHTHGGCGQTSGDNAGTSAGQSALQLALAAPMGVCDPFQSSCDDGPPGTPYCHCTQAAPCGNESAHGGCLHSEGGAALALAYGSNRIAEDDLVLRFEGLPRGNFGLVFMGPTQVAQSFGDGQRCVGAGALGIRRWGVQSTGPQGLMQLGPGLVGASVARFPGSGGIAAGETWNFQAWFRDPGGPCGSGSGTSSAVSVTFRP